MWLAYLQVVCPQGFNAVNPSSSLQPASLNLTKPPVLAKRIKTQFSQASFLGNGKKQILLLSKACATYFPWGPRPSRRASARIPKTVFGCDYSPCVCARRGLFLLIQGVDWKFQWGIFARRQTLRVQLKSPTGFAPGKKRHQPSLQPKVTAEHSEIACVSHLRVFLGVQPT